MHGSYFTLFMNKLLLWHHLAKMAFYFYESVFRILLPVLVVILTVTLMSPKLKAEELTTSISLDSLGELQVQFTSVTSANSYSAAPLTAKVSYVLAEQHMVIAPFIPQQTAMLLPHGSPVKQGQAIARISGSEVHHFQEMLASQKFVYDVTLERYKEGKNLFRKGAISIHKWAEIAEQYHDNKVAYGHLKHFSELLKITPNQDDSATLMAPIDGVLLFPEMIATTTNEPVLAVIVPHEQIKLAIAAPIQLATSITRVTTPFCDENSLAITSQEHTAENFHVTLWSESVSANCNLQLGQTVSVIPYLARTTQMLPKRSVFSWEQTPHVLVKQGFQLIPTPINIITSGIDSNEEPGYFIEPNANLANREVLSNSVSAVQGMLAGMGGE